MKNLTLAEEIVYRLSREKVRTEREFQKIQREVLKERGGEFPKGVELISAYKRLLKSGLIEKEISLERVLRRNRIRTLSGVAVVSILTKEAPCPGECIYCPTESGMPKSYLNGEPAASRAKQCSFHPRKQVEMRLRSLKLNGHPTDKVEVIIIGGTFSALSNAYKNWYVREVLKALNGDKSGSLKALARSNEKSEHRLVGLTVETRPDLISGEEVKRLRKLGVTRVELGVQSIYDQILKGVKRGHTRKEVEESTYLLKEAGFKVGYHLMPGLPGADVEKDLEMFKEIFDNPVFRPDQLKIYPCVVVKESELYKWWKEGRYEPYTDEELINLLVKVKSFIPPYVRISRLFRDIPATRIEAGCRMSNLRQVVLGEMKKRGLKCRCIRCREVRESPFKKLYLEEYEYEASLGKEIFLSFEDEENKIYSLLRLRIPSFFIKGEKPPFPELEGALLIRELHTYGELVPLRGDTRAVQHRGLGGELLKKAEEKTREVGARKLAVISAFGVRSYYRRFGYVLEGSYMVKEV
jgi:elongator complex protein 3